MKNQSSLLSIILLTTSLSQAQVPGYGLHNAISDAIKSFPNQEANQLQVRAAQLRASAQKKNEMFPTGHVNMGVNRSQYLGALSDASGQSSSAGISFSKNIYDGGAAKHRINAAELEARTLEAQLQSDDSYIPNTTGELATDVAMTFLELGLDTDYFNFYGTQRDLLNQLLNLKMADSDREMIGSQVRAFDATLAKFQNEALEQKSNLEFRKVNLPEKFDNLEETYFNLKIILAPYIQDIPLALQTAKENNQNFLAKKLNLRLQEELNQANKASLTRPKVSVTVGTGYDHFSYRNSAIQGSGGWNNSVGVNISLPLQMGSRDAIEASGNTVRAAQKLVDTEEEKFKHRITSSIKQAISQEAVMQNYKNNITQNSERLSSFATSLMNSRSISAVDAQTLLKLVSNLENSYGSYERELFNNGTMNLFKLEVSMGILLKKAKTF